MKDQLTRENKIEWVKPFTRGFFIAYWEKGIESYTRGISEKYGIGYSNLMFLPEEGGHGFYYGKKDFDKFYNEIFRRAISKKDYLEKEISLCEEKCEAMVGSAKVLAENSADKNAFKLLPLYKKYTEEFKDYCFYLEMVHVAEMYLERKIKEELAKALGIESGDEFDKNFATISTKIKRISAEESELEKLKMAKALISGEDISSRVDDYLIKFSWLPCYGLESKLLVKEDVLREIQEIEDPQDKLQQELEKEKSQRKSLEEVKKRFRENSELIYWMNILQEYLYLRTYRTDGIRRMMLHLITFFKELSSKTGLDYESMLYLRPKEIINLLDKNELPLDKELQERKKQFAYVIKDKKILFYSNKKEIEEIEKRELGQRDEEVRKLTGTPAHPGVVKGKVRIIRVKKDWKRLEAGDILVTTMTRPEMLPIIKKAGAVLTDEGGITCHAAITSRELKIPCIISMKSATRVFKDGDIVEVNAKKGVVKILEK